MAGLLAFLVAGVPRAEAITPEELERAKKLKKDVAELFQRREYKKAIPKLRTILDITPQDRTAARYLMIAQRQEMEVFCERADAAYRQADYMQAIREWEKILKLTPEDARVERQIEVARNLMEDSTLETMYALADGFLKAGEYESAVNELEKILQIKPDEEKARELLAYALQTIKDLRIQRHYEQAVVYMEQGKYDLAIEEWQSILELDKNQEEAARLIAAARRKKLNAMYVQAELSYEQGDYITSRDLYTKIVNENPTDLDVRKILSRLNETLKVVQKIEEEGKAWDMLRISLSNHISLEGDPKAAVVAAWYAEQLDPGNKIALSVRDFMEHQHLAVVRSLEAPVRDMNIIDQYLFGALNHIYEGRYDLAIQQTSIVIGLQPTNVLALKRLGSAYFAIGNKTKARAAWEKALKIAPDDAELKTFLRQAGG
jgi:tetratricopeptide (TPR) repeat protein